MKKVWQNVRLRESWVGAFCDARYDRLVACGNFFFLDQTQQADEICARLWKMILVFLKYNNANLCWREMNKTREMLTWQVYCLLASHILLLPKSWNTWKIKINTSYPRNSRVEVSLFQEFVSLVSPNQSSLKIKCLLIFPSVFLFIQNLSNNITACLINNIMTA